MKSKSLKSRKSLAKKRGATMVEYGLLIMAVLAVAAASFNKLGGSIDKAASGGSSIIDAKGAAGH